jgi:hypothetical protein
MDASGNTTPPGADILNTITSIFTNSFTNAFMDELGEPLQNAMSNTEVTPTNTTTPVVQAPTQPNNVPYIFTIRFDQNTNISGGSQFPFQQFNNTLMNIIPPNINNNHNQILRNRQRRYNILNRLGNILNTQFATQNTNFQFENVLQNSLNCDTKRLNILKEEEYVKWEKKRYKDMPETFREANKECAITMDEYTDDSVIVTMPCGHTMSEVACNDWFSINYKCPFCRKEYENRPMSDEEYRIYREKLDNSESASLSQNVEDDNQQQNVIEPSSVDNVDISAGNTDDETEDEEANEETTDEEEVENENNVALTTLLRNTLGTFPNVLQQQQQQQPPTPGQFLQPVFTGNLWNASPINRMLLQRQEELDLQRAIEESMRTR